MFIKLKSQFSKVYSIYSMSIVVKQFDPTLAEINRAYLIIGRKGSGKSTLMFTLLGKLAPRIHYAVAMCGTRDGVEKFGRVMPADVIHNSFNPAIFSSIIKTLARNSMVSGYKTITSVILDDLAFAKGTFKSEEMRESLMNGRWLGLNLVMTQQYLMDLGPDLRGQIDYIFAMAETTKKTRQKLFDYYYGIFNTFADFERVFSAVTSKKGRALVLDNTTTTSVISDRVFYYDGDINASSEFTIGCSTFHSHLALERIRRFDVSKGVPTSTSLNNQATRGGGTSANGRAYANGEPAPSQEQSKNDSDLII